MRRGNACWGFSKTMQDVPCATRGKSVAGRPWGIARYTSRSPSCSIRRNSNPAAFPPAVSRCMPSVSPRAGASQTSSLKVPRSSPDHCPASQPSSARPGEPWVSTGQSGTVAKSSKASRIIGRSVKERAGSSCAEVPARVLDGSDTEQLPEPPGVDERRRQRTERLEQRARRQPRHPAELPGEMGLIDVVQLGRELGPARLPVSQQQRCLHAELGGEGSRRKPHLAEERALQGSLGDAGGRPERSHGDPPPGSPDRLDRAIRRVVGPAPLQAAAEE